MRSMYLAHLIAQCGMAYFWKKKSNKQIAAALATKMDVPLTLQTCSLIFLKNLKYCKVKSSNTSCLEANDGFLQIAYEGDFRSLCTVTLWQKVDFLIS